MTEPTDKEFVKQYIAFKELRKAGMFKGIDSKDYPAIVSRFLKFFGQTKREYILSLPVFDMQLFPNQVNGHMPYYVDKNGELVTKTGFHLSM